MPPDAIPEPWHSFLKELDGTLAKECHLHCIGGFVVTLVYGFSRPTSEIDVLAVFTGDRFGQLMVAGGKGSRLHAKHQVYLDRVAIATVPENYEARLTNMFPGAFKYLRLLALDPYDLALAKLERNVQRDRDDVRYLARKLPLDPTILKERCEKELRPYLARPEREDLTIRLWIEMIEEDRQR